MNKNLIEINDNIYKRCSYVISNFMIDLESTAYDACYLEINTLRIISRSSKITPKKTGQFVTFWKRNINGITEPYSETDTFDYFIINVKSKNNFGQFVFPKSILISKRILTTKNKEGKRGFRVYPIWDATHNKQAKQTQEWQLNYFYEICINTDIKNVKKLYSNHITKL